MEELNTEFSKLYFEICNKLDELRVASERHGFDRMYITMGSHEDVSPGDYYIILGASKENPKGYHTWEAEIIGKDRIKADVKFSERDYTYKKGDTHEHTL